MDHMGDVSHFGILYNVERDDLNLFLRFYFKGRCCEKCQKLAVFVF